MKLHPVDGIFLVAKSHDLSLLRLRCDFQAIGKRVAFHNEGMIAGSFERRGEAGEESLSVVKNR